MTAPSARHETRALLRAHLAAASGRRHVTRHCPVCHRLLRLAMEPAPGRRAPERATGTTPEPSRAPVEDPTARQTPPVALEGPQDAVSAPHGRWEEERGESPPNE
ncbi:DUF6274 family protein [Streptomyces sp. NPDC049954]|uniref:DUF6274 family protein n=1 Tax=Streptomyces sp. NPDC049954 TaxID=3155779 RepID=UPI0034373237